MRQTEIKLSEPLTFLDDPLATDCYSVRLLLEFLQIPYHSVYHTLNSDKLQQVPSLIVKENTVEGMAQSLIYLIQYTPNASNWLPEHAPTHLEKWLTLNQKFKQNLGTLRQATLMEDQYLVNEAELIAQANFLLLQLDDHLCNQTIQSKAFLESLSEPTLADLIIFPQVALAWDAGVSLVPFLHIRRWVNKIRHQMHFIPMAGLLAVG